METKDDLIQIMCLKLLRIFNKHSQIETMKIHFDEAVEVTPKEIHTIQAIGKNKHINITGLGTHFGVSKSAASQIITKLVKKGFVKKELSLHSNKEFALSLTELGWKAFYAHEEIHEKHMTDLIKRLNAFSLSQIATTSVVLEVIENVVDERLSWLLKR
ncbi:Regulatory protein MarR [Candidatus Magnetomoraceae bacterium gMMP-1]